MEEIQTYLKCDGLENNLQRTKCFPVQIPLHLVFKQHTVASCSYLQLVSSTRLRLHLTCGRYCWLLTNKVKASTCVNSHSVMLWPSLPPPNTMRNKPYLQLGRGLAVPFTETMHHLSRPSSAINQHCHTQTYRPAVPATSGVNRNGNLKKTQHGRM